MSKIEECFLLFQQYVDESLDPYTYIKFFDDESGCILIDEDNIIINFDSFQECIDILKEKLK